MLMSKAMAEKPLSIGNDVNGLDTGPKSSPDEPQESTGDQTKILTTWLLQCICMSDKVENCAAKIGISLLKINRNKCLDRETLQQYLFNKTLTKNAGKLIKANCERNKYYIMSKFEGTK